MSGIMKRSVRGTQECQPCVSNSNLGVGKSMDLDLQRLKENLDTEFSLFGPKKGHETASQVMEMVNKEDFRAASGGRAGMIQVHPTGSRDLWPEAVLEPRPPISKEDSS